MSKIEKLVCPACTAPLDVGVDSENVVCSYCGTTVKTGIRSTPANRMLRKIGGPAAKSPAAEVKKYIAIAALLLCAATITICAVLPRSDSAEPAAESIEPVEIAAELSAEEDKSLVLFQTDGILLEIEGEDASEYPYALKVYCENSLPDPIYVYFSKIHVNGILCSTEWQEEILSGKKMHHDVLFTNLPVNDVKELTLHVRILSSGEMLLDDDFTADMTAYDKSYKPEPISYEEATATLRGTYSGCWDGSENNRIVDVSTVDELLNAISSNTTINLAPGEYNLTKASGYGVSGGQYYYWLDVGDGFCLWIEGVNHLTLNGEDAVIVTEPRQADVLRLETCSSISINGLTFGHTPSSAECGGGVLDICRSENIALSNCHMFGCGTIGISSFDCDCILVDSCEIYDCTYGSVNVQNCRSIDFVDCSMHDCGGGIAANIVNDASFINCKIYNNYSCDGGVFQSACSSNVRFIGNEISGNSGTVMLILGDYAGAPKFITDERFLILDDCKFTDNSFDTWYQSSGSPYIFNLAGDPLDFAAFDSMAVK